MEKLNGGFINNIYRVGKVVEKHYLNDHLVGLSSEERLFRERTGLKRFSDFTPTLLGFSNGVVYQEFLEGTNLEGDTTHNFEAGQTLRAIHQPVRRNFSYVQDQLIRRFERNINETGLDVKLDINWDEVAELGTTRVHRDFWLGNLLLNGKGIQVVDWELSGIGSPYEDFAIVDLWIFREYGGEADFWRGYGLEPNKPTINEFLKMACVKFLASYKGEDPIGFYKNKLEILANL